MTTPTLGISFASAAISASLKVTDGALAQTVDPKGPAGKAGLLGIRRGLAGVVPGDVIVGVDGKRIRASSDVEAAIDNKSVGDKLQVTYKRGNDGVRVPGMLWRRCCAVLLWNTSGSVPSVGRELTTGRVCAGGE